MVRGSTIDVSKTHEVDLSIHNKFDIEVVDAKSGVVKQRAEAYNIIKDCFWDYFFTDCATSYCGNWFGAIVFGGGSGTPSPEVNGLFSFIGGKTATGAGTASYPDKGYAYHRKSITLGVSEFNGKTITEVGVSVYGTNQANRIFTHAMLQDMNGNQISITKTDTDIITIYATIYVHWNPNGYEDGKIKIWLPPARLNDKGIINELLGYMEKSNVDRTVRFFNGPPVQNAFAIGSINTYFTKNREQKKMTITAYRLGVDSGNGHGGILSAYVAGIMLFAPCSGLPGTNIVAEAVGTGDGVKTQFNTKFAFPQDAEIYVDGVLCADVTVSPGEATSRLYPTAAFKFIPELSTGRTGVPMSQYNGSTGEAVSSDGYSVFENIYADHGVAKIYVANGINWAPEFELSDDGVNWTKLTKVSNGNKLFNVPAECAYYKYWKVSGGTAKGLEAWAAYPQITPIVPFDTHSIVFATPPAEGSVITANYFTPAVAKDSNHVFDMSITIHLGEYTE